MEILQNGAVIGVTIGNGRNDGKPRVYATCFHGSVYEFEWTESGWLKVKMGQAPLWPYMATVGKDIVIADGRGDGKLRVYATCGYGVGIHEFEWTGSSWIKKEIDSGPTTTISAGDARGDGKPRVYGCFSIYIYELEWTNQK